MIVVEHRGIELTEAVSSHVCWPRLLVDCSWLKVRYSSFELWPRLATFTGLDRWSSWHLAIAFMFAWTTDECSGGTCSTRVEWLCQNITGGSHHIWRAFLWWIATDSFGSDSVVAALNHPRTTRWGTFRIALKVRVTVFSQGIRRWASCFPKLMWNSLKIIISM